MKKSTHIIVSFLLMLTMMASSAFATSSHIITDEQQLNTLLAEIGTPEEVISGLIYDAKYNLINNTGTDLKFEGYNKQLFTKSSATGELTPIADASFHLDGLISFISPDDLSIVLSHFTYTSGGVTYHDLYSAFEWVGDPSPGPPGIDKDQIGIAVPTDWEIQTTGYACAVQSKTYFGIGGIYWGPWDSPDSSRCGNNGQPSSTGVHGASWELHGGTVIQRFKGTAHLLMINRGSTTNRAVSTYMEAHNNPLGNFSVSIGYGPASISYTPTSGSTDIGTGELVWP